MTRRSALAGLAATALFAPACRPSETALDADIVVIGAGLSGLYTAMLLQDEGRDVQVVEALPRVGGRLWTLDHDDGFTEGGGQQIGANYARVLDVADRLGVPLYAQSGRGPDTAYHLNGTWSEGDLNILQFPAAFRSTPPPSVLFRLLAQTPGLDAADSWLDAAPEFDISAAQFLGQHGFDADARALIDHTLNGNSLETYSMLNLHRTWQLYRQSGDMGATRYVQGGSQRLPEAMAATLARPVQLDSPVADIALGTDRVEIGLTSGRIIRATQAVCTLPFPALRGMRSLLAQVNDATRKAVGTLPYTQILQVHMRASPPIDAAGRAAPHIWSDTDVERVFTDTDRNGAPSGYRRGWINGTGVERWTDLDHAKVGRAYADRVAALRPSAQAALEPLAVVDWTLANARAGGAYYHWAPGQAARLAREMGRAVGPLHFAGEHLGILHTGMEAAMESAERAALAIIEGTR